MTVEQEWLKNYLIKYPTWHDYNDLFENVYSYYVWDKSLERKIRNDFRELNINESNEYIFISSNKGYKVASKEDIAKYIKTLEKTVLRKLKLYNTICNKSRLKGQLNANGDMVLKDIMPYIE